MNQIRIALTAEDFKKLISGGELVFSEKSEVHIILKDIGHSEMFTAIEHEVLQHDPYFFEYRGY